MDDTELAIAGVLGLGALWWFTRHHSCGCAPGASSCGCDSTTKALGVPPAPGTATLQGTQPSLLMSLCEAGAKAGASAGAGAAGVPPQTGGAVATPGVTGPLCSALGKGLKIVGHEAVVVGKDIGKAGAATGRFIGHETAAGAKAVAHVTTATVKGAAKVVGKVGSGLESGAKAGVHAVSSGIHKVLGWL